MPYNNRFLQPANQNPTHNKKVCGDFPQRLFSARNFTACRTTTVFFSLPSKTRHITKKVCGDFPQRLFSARNFTAYRIITDLFRTVFYSLCSLRLYILKYGEHRLYVLVVEFAVNIVFGYGGNHGRERKYAYKVGYSHKSV